MSSSKVRCRGVFCADSKICDAPTVESFRAVGERFGSPGADGSRFRDALRMVGREDDFSNELLENIMVLTNLSLRILIFERMGQ